jgi:hypothetical protein
MRSTQDCTADALNAVGSNLLTLYDDNEKEYAYSNLRTQIIKIHYLQFSIRR